MEAQLLNGWLQTELASGKMLECTKGAQEHRTIVGSWIKTKDKEFFYEFFRIVTQILFILSIKNLMVK